jgi:hypothetical protein
MGYRNYIGSIPKREYNKIKRFTLKELHEYKGETWSEDRDENGYVGPYEILRQSHYELGKYVDEFPKRLFKTFFKNKETQNNYTEEGDFYVVEKEFLLAVIEMYRDKVRAHYKTILDPFFSAKGVIKAEFLKKKENPITDDEMTAIFLMIDHVRGMGVEWGVTGWFPDEVPYDIKEGSGSIVSSWRYEYAIFQLVNLYHSFDWKRNVMVYYGY